ncbi:MAG: hypothetical protein WDO69_14125 [Pseudomonadota bacterium]
MQITALARRLLKLVFALSSSSTALTRPRLERGLGTSASELNQAITEVSRLGLLDAQRLRLTFLGLTLAVASGARSRAKPRLPAAKAPPASATRAPIALFSQREAPRAVA